MDTNKTLTTPQSKTDDRPPLTRMVAGALNELHKLYPQSHMCLIGTNLKEIKGKEAIYDNIFHEIGNSKLIDTAAVDCCMEDTRAAYHFRNVFLTYMVNVSRSELTSFVSRRLHDDIINFAKELGLDVSGTTYYCPSANDTEKKSAYIHTMGQEMTYADDVEAHISELEKEIARLRELRNPATLTKILTAEIKRLRKAGDFDGVARKTIELNKILDEEKQRLDNERHRKELYQKRVEQAAHARAMKIVRKHQAEEQQRIEAAKDAERERQRKQQASRNAALKARMQRKAEEQAERKKRKRKAQEGMESQPLYTSPMFQNLKRAK